MLTIQDVSVFKKATDRLWKEFSKQDYEKVIGGIIGEWHQVSPGHQKMVDHGLLELVRTQYVDRLVDRDVWRYPDGVMILESEYHDMSWDDQHKFDEAHRRGDEREKNITIKYPQKVKQNVWRVNRDRLNEVIEEFKRLAAEL